MKRLIAIATFTFLGIGAAAAQQPWSGPYFGANIGWASDDAKTTDLKPYAALASPGAVTKSTGSGVLGGFQAGYNWQFGGIVAGFEADVGYLAPDNTTFLAATASGTKVGVSPGGYADITGRLGVTVTPAILLYAKGGYAITDAHDNFSTVSGSFSSISHTGTFSGVTYGLGGEMLLGNRWTAKLEYQRFDFGSQGFTVYNATLSPFSFNEKLTYDTVKLGINYKF